MKSWIISLKIVWTQSPCPSNLLSSMLMPWGEKVENENVAEFSSFGIAIPCITHYPIEKQFQELYTNAKFREDQDEFKGLLYCCATLVTCNGAMYTYQVRDGWRILRIL